MSGAWPLRGSRLPRCAGAGKPGTPQGLSEQEEPIRRRVVLMTVGLGLDTMEVIARFEAGRRALALMDPLNMARVFDAGATDTGRPCPVMEPGSHTPATEAGDRLAMFASH